MYNPKGWCVFKLKDLFDIETGVDLIYGDLEDGEYPVIGHCEFNHGITRYTKKLDDYKLYNHTKTISLGDRGTFIAYVQPQDFYIGTRVKALTARFSEANIYILMFIATCINLEQYKFCYGRNATNKTPNIEIKLPTTSKGKPDWKFMENFIKKKYKKEEKKTTTKIKSLSSFLLDVSSWKTFKISELFACNTTPTVLETVPGSIPYVTRTSLNNGVDSYVSETTKLNDGNCITIGAEGIFAFYQPNKFVSGVKIYTLRNHELNKYNALFICTLLNQEVYRYSYGRARILNKIKEEYIKLPTDSKGNLDWQFMENYIKSLPYSDLI